MSLTPFTGINVHASMSFDSRGYAKSGKVHFSERPVKAGEDSYTICGRALKAVDVYQDSASGALLEEHRRLAKTHVVHTCAQCVRYL